MSIYCPTCGQQQVSDETRFCSRCGFLLTGVAEVIANGGLARRGELDQALSSPRKRGLKQGLFIFLLAFLVVPILTIITIAVNAEPFAVVISLVLLTVGGLLRMAYALMFESSMPGAAITLEEKFSAASKRGSVKQGSPTALPSQGSTPIPAYMSPPAGTWRDTNELDRFPGSVTDGTTRLLQREHDTQ